MLSVNVDEALARLKSAARVTEAFSTPLDSAAGRVLARPITAIRDQPPAAVSAMDGYAVASDGKRLKIVGESRAGAMYQGLISGDRTVRVFTGAVVPEGTIAVVLQENITAADGWITVDVSSVKPHLRRRGQDFKAEDVVLRAGDRLDALNMALAASAGVGEVWVRRRPRVAIVGSGNELVRPGEAARTDQVYEASLTALSRLVAHWGGEVASAACFNDDPALLASKLAEADADFIVTIGGASVGEYDCVRPALAALDVSLIFDGVAIRPGRPTLFGRNARGQTLLGLPGNPSTALIVAHLFLKPFLSWCLAMESSNAIAVPCWEALPANASGQDIFLRSRYLHDEIHGRSVAPLQDQDASLITGLARSDGLIRRRAGAPEIAVGTIVSFVPFDRI